MITDWIIETDFRILNWIQEYLRCEFLDQIIPVFTSLGEKGWFFILAAIIMLCIPKYRKWGLSLGLALLFGLLFGNLLIKNIVARTRPYDMVEEIVLLVNPLSDYSFPSGHTMAAFEFFAVVCMMPIKKRYKVLAGVLAFTMAFSRLYLYVHFPSDVLVGMLLGTLFGLMGVFIANKIKGEKSCLHESNEPCAGKEKYVR